MADTERRIGERVARLEERSEDQGRIIDAVAPVAVHLAEMNVKYAEIQRSTDRIENRLDDLHPRLRKLEYAVVALTVTVASTVASPLLGGPSVGHSVSVVLQHLT